MSKVLVSEENLTNIANAIREKNGETTTYKPGDMAAAIQNISSGDGASIPEKGFVVNEWSNIGRPMDISVVGITEIPDGYFQYFAYGLQYNNLGVSAKIHLPDNLTSIGNYSFDHCTRLEDLKIPNSVSNIGERAFYECQSLKSLDISGVNSVKRNCFYNCTSLENIILSDNLTYIDAQGFSNCSKLKLITLPNNLKTLSQGSFNGCKLLSIKELPIGVTVIPETCFGRSGITELKCLGEIVKIDKNAFWQSTALKKLILLNVTTVPTLSNINAFSETPIENGTGYIYVPDILVDSFKIATNWSTYANQIKPISDLNIQSIEIACADSINTYINNTMNINVTYNGGQTSLYFPEQEDYTLSVSGNATLDGNILTLTDEAQTGDIITITVTSTYDNSISSTKEIEVIYLEASISVNLNEGQWVDSGTYIDGNIVYQSDAGSYHMDYGKSIATITIDGYTSVKLYIRSFAESTFDYTEAFAIDTTATRGKGLFTTKEKQSATDYVECVYELDGETHTIDIMYSKDNGGNTNDDRGYFYIGECS